MAEIKTCKNCVLDTTDIDIYFDADGVCNHCLEWIPRVSNLPKTLEQEKLNLEEISCKIRVAGKDNEF